MTDLNELQRMAPTRIQLSRVKGWRMPPNTASVARPGRWGNPFYVSKWRDAATCVALFRNAMHGIWDPDTSAHCPPAWNGYAEHCGFRLKLGAHPMDLVHELRGMNLACWCKLGEPCHADVLLELANGTALDAIRVAFETRPEQVRVMARAEGYAMVRLPGCMPFVVREKELRSPSPNKP